MHYVSKRSLVDILHNFDPFGLAIDLGEGHVGIDRMSVWFSYDPGSMSVWFMKR